VSSVERWTLYRPVPPGSPFTRLTIKAALVIGFGVTFGVWLWSGYQLTARMTELETQTTDVNMRYMRAQELLASVRAQVLLASLSVRDALLDPDASTARTYVKQFEDTLRLADEAMDQYVPVLSSTDEKTRIDALRREISDFHRAMLAVLTADGATWRRDARALLRQTVAPRREVVMRVSDQVQALNRTAFVEQRNQTAALYGDAQRRTWLRLGGALAASLGIGLLAIVYAGRLEARLRRQRRRDLQLADDLHRLSGRITTLQEDERRAIARELHDEVGQALTAMRVGLALAQTSVDSPQATARIADARDVAETTLQRIRTLSHLLHPPMLDDLGLPAAIKSYLEDFAARHGIETHLQQQDMDTRLTPEVETALYRIVQEGLTNVAKHARARSCRVHLEGLMDSVRVTIEDDGAGFDSSIGRSPEERGLGLIGIRERVARLGGVFQIESAAGQGSTVMVEVPV
jgi:signal transduction histidine kinase